MPPIRRLTAIIAADVAGYSRLMGLDEEGTHERLQAHFRELVNPKVGEHRGRIVKNSGDGVLAEFPSVVDAVRCAVEIQRGMIDREPDVPEEGGTGRHLHLTNGAGPDRSARSQWPSRRLAEPKTCRNRHVLGGSW